MVNELLNINQDGDYMKFLYTLMIRNGPPFHKLTQLFHFGVPDQGRHCRSNSKEELVVLFLLRPEPETVISQ